MKKIFLLLMAIIPFLFSSCTKEQEEGSVTVKISGSVWSDVFQDEDLNSAKAGAPKSSAANGPIRLYFVRQGTTTFAKSITITSGNSVNVSLPTGNYTVYALCGLTDDSAAPTDLNSVINLSSSNPLPDVQLGSKSITVSTSSTPSLDIEVDHLLTNLSLNLIGVPSTVTSLRVYVRNLYDGFTLSKVFSQSASMSIPVSVAQDNATSTTYSGQQIIFPCASNTSMDVLVEAHDVNGYTTLLQTSTTPASSGDHLTLNLNYADLIPLSGGVTVSDWGTTTGTGDLTGFNFVDGDQYFSYPATVIRASTSALYIVSHLPITLTKAELDAMPNPQESIAYTLIPDLIVNRWYIPANNGQPGNVISKISDINSQIVANGGTAIDLSATNILAYCTYGADGHPTAYYCYDFQNNTTVQATNLTSSSQFILYPIGKILLAQ